MEILCSSLLRYESFFSIDDKRGIIIYLFKYIYHFRFLFQYRTIIHTLLNNLVDSQKKKKIILSKFLQCLQKTSLKKGNASKQWCFCCSRVNGHGKTKYACLWPGWHAEMLCFILMPGKTLIALQILII